MARCELHHDSPRLERALAACSTRVGPFDGIVYRATGIRYATQDDMISGRGAQDHGARWNPPGLFPAVYASLGPDLALKETIGTNAAYGVPPSDRLPLVMVAIEVRLKRVLDLTEGPIRRRLKVSREDLVTSGWQSIQDRGMEAISQAIGRIASDRGIEGLIVPSARLRSGRNLVIFLDQLAGESSIRVINRDRLPPGDIARP